MSPCAARTPRADFQARPYVPTLNPPEHHVSGLFLFCEFLYNPMAMATGCSIPVVRAHGVGVDWVQFPAARPKKNSSPMRGGFFFC